MAGCNVDVEYTIPKGWGYKTLTYKCGNTGIDGYPVLCDDCKVKYRDVDWREEARLNGENFDDDY